MIGSLQPGAPQAMAPFQTGLGILNSLLEAGVQVSEAQRQGMHDVLDSIAKTSQGPIALERPFIALSPAQPYLGAERPDVSARGIRTPAWREMSSMLSPSSPKRDLVAWLAKGIKPADAVRVGTEHEKFPYYVSDLSPVPYEGERGIAAILAAMKASLGWEAIEDDGALIGLYDGHSGAAISLEPGGQFELSGAPVANIHDTADELDAHLKAAHAAAQPLGVGFLSLGMSPKWSLAETPKMPKNRYRIMTRYMPKVGTRGLDMMYRTSTVQANLDFTSEADMVTKLRVGLALQPMITALFANSPFTEGKPNGLLSARSDIWLHTDNDRSGMLPFAFEPGMGFERYVDYALDVPMYFVKRGDVYHDVAGQSFRDLLERQTRGAARRARHALGLGEPPLHDLSRSAAQAVSRNARRRRWLARTHRRVAGADGRPLLRL